MKIDVIRPLTCIKVTKLSIESVNRVDKSIRVKSLPSNHEIVEGDHIAIQDSYNYELLGIPISLEKMFRDLWRSQTEQPLLMADHEERTAFTDLIQETIDNIEETGGMA